MKKIVIVQFDKSRFDPQLEKQLLEIADWYEFQNLSETDKDFEIQDLKENYEIVLELR